MTFNSADTFHTHCKLHGVILKRETIPVVRDPPVARDKPADPLPRGKGQDRWSLTSNVTPYTFIPPPPPLRQNYPDPGRYYFGTMDIRNVLLLRRYLGID